MNQYNSVFLDTNILLHHTFEDLDNAKNKLVTDTINNLFGSGCDLYISSQVIREFFAISTNAKVFQSPLTVEKAILKIQEFQDNLIVLYDSESTLTILKQLVIQYKIERQKIHDTNIVATILANEIEVLFTFNTKDFKIFPEIKLLI